MKSSDEFPIRVRDPEVDEEEYKTINWVYEMILGIPLLVYSIVMGILAWVTTVELVGDWQIWTFLSLGPGLGFIGGFILTRDELRKSLFYGSVFLTGLLALMMMGLLGTREIIGGGSGLDVLIAFAGGLFWGIVFGIMGCIFLILATIGSFYLKKLLSNIQLKKG